MAKAWEQNKELQASDATVYIVVGLTEHTVTVMRVAWMWDKNDHFTSSVVGVGSQKLDIYRQQIAKYTEQVQRVRVRPGSKAKDPTEYVVLANGSTLRSTGHPSAVELKRLEDAAGVVPFRIVRAKFDGPITSPYDALLRKYNEYSAVTDDAGNPKLHVIFGGMMNLLEEGVLAPALVERFVKDIEAEYKDFHSGLPLPKGSENWRTLKTVQLLYATTVKVDKAYAKRAERHLRGMIKWDEAYQQYAAYAERKVGKPA